MKKTGTRLQEWVNYFDQRLNWKAIEKLASNKASNYTDPVSLEAIELIYKYFDKIQLEDYGNQVLFEKRVKRKFSLKEWRNLNSKINQLCLNYIKVNQAQIYPLDSDLMLQKELLEKGIWKAKDALSNKNKKALEEYRIYDAYHGVRLVKWNEIELMDIRKKDSRKKLIGLEQFELGVDLFYHENKLRILCEKASRLSYQKDEELTIEEQNWLDKIPDSILHFPQIQLFSLCYQIMLKKSDSAFFELKDKLVKELSKKVLTNDYLQNFYEYLQTHCIQRINEEKYRFANEYMAIFDVMLREDMLTDNGYLPSWRFKNIVKVGSKELLLENADRNAILDKIDNFIEENQHRLIPSSQDSIVHYCQALVSYLRLDIRKAEKLLVSTSLHYDEIIKIESLFLYLFVLLELDDTDQFLRSRNNLQEMIYRKKGRISDTYIEVRIKSIYYINKAQNAPLVGQRSFFRAYLKEIMASDNFIGKDWLIGYLKRKLVD